MKVFFPNVLTNYEPENDLNWPFFTNPSKRSRFFRKLLKKSLLEEDQDMDGRISPEEFKGYFTRSKFKRISFNPHAVEIPKFESLNLNNAKFVSSSKFYKRV